MIYAYFIYMVNGGTIWLSDQTIFSQVLLLCVWLAFQIAFSMLTWYGLEFLRRKWVPYLGVALHTVVVSALFIVEGQGFSDASFVSLTLVLATLMLGVSIVIYILFDPDRHVTVSG
jgi:hypothetical protein